ncbi:MULTISPECIES: class I SAM-dependent methyltransferase [Flavobacterium]|uniref:Class I SAM-dependent methyltransferase n=1 Tax=Flavobacterium jumunjinense TaxID=998845 RepID=A0ABV5GQW6_9FLAO|nr:MULTISPECIES: class I SAM-dependent methyltransferase [Flavobacterium]
MNNCKICNSKIEKIFTTKILYKYDVDYFRCINCKFVQTEQPYWLEESYANPMNLTDTGIMLRNNRSSKIVTSIILLFFKKEYNFIDYAGGYGVFTRLMRDIGFNFHWNDPYTKNLLSRGFEQKESIKYDVVTSFESFEHFEEPLTEIEKIFSISKNVIFSTELIPDNSPNPETWWYYGREHGQHIALYSRKSMEFLAKKYDVNYYNLNNLHFFTTKKINILSSMFLRFKYAKHILYILSFPLQLFLKSKTMSDMESLKK